MASKEVAFAHFEPRLDSDGQLIAYRIVVPSDPDYAAWPPERCDTVAEARKKAASAVAAKLDRIEAAPAGDTATAQKLDTGKAPMVRGLLNYFPRALRAVAEVSAFGFDKYKVWGGWRGVQDGEARYSDALLRHFTYRAGGEVFDPEAAERGHKIRHAAEVAWNALAVLDLELAAAEAEARAAGQRQG